MILENFLLGQNEKMKSVEEFREYFKNAKDEELQKLLYQIHATEGAAYIDHILSPQIDRELGKSLAKIAGLSEEDRKELIQVADKYAKEVQSEIKDQRPFALPFKKKKKILAKLLFGTTAAAIIGGGAYLLSKILKNSDEEYRG